MAKSISKVYGNALYELAEEQEKVEVLLKEAAAFLDVLSDSAELNSFLNYPRLTSEEKMKKLEDIFQGSLSEELLGLVNIVLVKGREQSLKEILQSFISQAEEALGIGNVYVTLPSEPTAQQKKAIEEKLLATTQYKTLKVNYKTDPALIGGMVIRVKDRVVDSSIRSRLNRLESDLKKVQLI